MPLPKYTNEPNFHGYPVFYIKDGHTPLCNECATEEWEAESGPLECTVNWENTSLYCDTCSEQLESAYGVLQAESEKYPTFSKEA